MKSRKRTSIVLILSLLLTLLSAIGTGEAFAADSKGGLISYARVDCLDYSEKPGQLAMDIVADRDGKAFFYAARPGDTYTLAALKQQGQNTDFVDVKKGKETTLFSSNTVTEGQSYDCQVIFVDSSGAEYGPYVLADEKANLFPAGTGTVANPYQIWTARQFYNLRSLEGKTENNNAVVMDHINLDQVMLKGQIGAVGGTFYGALEGNSYVVTGITGRIFSTLAKGARISNLHLNGNNVTSSSFYTENNYGTIEHCIAGWELEAVSLMGTPMQPMGVFANSNYGTITDCSASTLGLSGDSEVGGITGRNMGIIDKCDAEGEVRATAENGMAGGIAGRNVGGTIINCKYWMMPHGDSPMGSITGGIAGVNEGTLMGNESEWKSSNSSKSGSIVGQWSEDSINTNNYNTVKKTPSFTLDANGEPTTAEHRAQLKKEWRIRHGNYGNLPPSSEVTKSVRSRTSTKFKPAQLAQATLDLYRSTTVEYNQVNPMCLLVGETDEITLRNYNGNTLVDYSATYGRGKDYEAKVSMPKSGTIVVNYDFSLNPTGNIIELYNSQGAKVESVAIVEREPKARLYISTAKAGTYKLKISTSASESSKALFSMSYAPVGGTLTNAKPFLGASPSGSTAYYKITLPSDGYISFATLSPGKENKVKAEIRLMNAKKKSLLKKGQKFNMGTASRTAGLKNGTYYLAVKCDEPAYAIQYTFHSIKDKSGSTRGRATSIPEGRERNGIITITDDASSADYYKIVVKKTHKVRMWIRPYYEYAMKVSIYKGSSTKAMTIKYPTGMNSSVLYRTLKPGTYYVKISKYGTGVGSGGYRISW